METIEANFGVHIDHYAEVDFTGFEKVIDTVGGVTIDNPYPIKDDEYPGPGNQYMRIYFRPGWQHMDGERVLQYARTRHDDGDSRRSARQQQVLLALVRKYVNPSVHWNLDNLLLTLDSLRTDIDLADLPTLLEMARRARKAEVVGTVLQPPRFSLYAGIEPNSARGWVMIPNVAEMRAYAQSVMGD
jgi:anionic cell wall polymer biosynthesis LytR-Cps2A-Psr (LCP) family protein